MIISIKIRNIRNKLNMSQREFGEAIGYSQSAVAQWELSQKIPTFKAMVSIFNVAKSKKIKINEKNFFSLS